MIFRTFGRVNLLALGEKEWSIMMLSPNDWLSVWWIGSYLSNVSWIVYLILANVITKSDDIIWQFTWFYPSILSPRVVHPPTMQSWNTVFFPMQVRTVKQTARIQWLIEVRWSLNWWVAIYIYVYIIIHDFGVSVRFAAPSPPDSWCLWVRRAHHWKSYGAVSMLLHPSFKATVYELVANMLEHFCPTCFVQHVLVLPLFFSTCWVLALQPIPLKRLKVITRNRLCSPSIPWNRHTFHCGGKVDFRELNLENLDIPMMENGVNSRLNAKNIMCFFHFVSTFFPMWNTPIKKQKHSTHTHTLHQKDVWIFLHGSRLEKWSLQELRCLWFVFLPSLKLTGSSPPENGRHLIFQALRKSGAPQLYVSGRVRFLKAITSFWEELVGFVEIDT